MGELVESQFFREIDPLQIEMILELVLANCTFDSLKNARLVCKKWYKASLSSWRKTKVLRIGLKENDLTTCTLPEFKNHFENDSFHQLQFKPYKSYKVIPSKRDNGWLFSSRELQPHIRHLEISLWYFELSLKSQLFGSILGNLKSLESLKFSGLVLSSFWKFSQDEANKLKSVQPLEKLKSLEFDLTNFGYQVYDSFWKCFVTPYMPSLETIIVHNENYNCIFRMLSTIKETRLKELIITGGTRTGSVIPQAGTGCLSYESRQYDSFLKRMTVNLGNIDGRVLKNMFISNQNNLEYLNAHGRIHLKTLKPVEPMKKLWDNPITMSSLKEMNLNLGMKATFHLLHCLRLPALEKLVITSKSSQFEGRWIYNVTSYTKQVLNEESQTRKTRSTSRKDPKEIQPVAEEIQLPNQFQSLMGHLEFENLKHFELLSKYCILSHDELECLAGAMRNLEHVTIALTSETFPTLCSHFEKLTSLHILKPEGRKRNYIDDAALTGIPVGGVNREASETDHIRSPNITSLRNLTRLTISHGKPILTDHSVINGLQHLSQLVKLQCSFKRLTAEVRKILEGKVTALEIKVDNMK